MDKLIREVRAAHAAREAGCPRTVAKWRRPSAALKPAHGSAAPTAEGGAGVPAPKEQAGAAKGRDLRSPFKVVTNELFTPTP